MQQRVILVRWTPDADQLAMEAAALCYDSKPSREVIRFCLGSGHESPLEHNAFTFKIHVSRIISQQFTRHRIASFSQRSQRYCVEDNFDYYTPPEIANNPEAHARWREFQEEVRSIYKLLIEMKIPAESARMALSNATETIFYMTMNARELRHFFKLRLCNRAQKEIRQIARSMLEQVKKVAPLLFEDVDYPCFMAGYCDQGKMGCGLKPSLEKVLALANAQNDQDQKA